jgi:histidyl-tRNA synthetase
MIKKIKGFTDLFPPEVDKYLFMEEVAREVFSLYGFKEIRIPIVEKTELFARSIGDDTDVVQKEMFSFPDRKGRILSLRPEATAGVVRAYIENKIYRAESLSKFFTVGPMFRYERPQKGRQRQFHQINVEAFGSSSPYLDAEIIGMLWEFLKRLNLSGILLEINSLGCRECRNVFLDNLREFLKDIESEKLCEDCRVRRDRNPLRVLDCKSEKCQKIYQDAPIILDFLCDGCKTHFYKVLELLQGLNIEFNINKKLVRGLDYYQRTTFEVVAKGIGAQSAIAGGGRYDGLIKDLDGPDVPGIGFACGMERIFQLLDYKKKDTLDFYIALLDFNALDTGFFVMNVLRQRGYRCISTFEIKSVKSHLRSANKMEARYCVLIGENELVNNMLTIKDLSSGEQRTIQKEKIKEIDFSRS